MTLKPWLELASKVMNGDFRKADRSTMDSLTYGLSAHEFKSEEQVQKAIHRLRGYKARDMRKEQAK